MSTYYRKKEGSPLKLVVTSHKPNSDCRWKEEITFANYTGKDIKYITFYLCQQNTVGDFYRPKTPFRVPCNCLKGTFGYVTIDTGWIYRPDFVRGCSIYYEADVEYTDGTYEKIQGDNFGFGLDKLSKEYVFDYMSVIKIIAIILCFLCLITIFIDGI